MFRLLMPDDDEYLIFDGGWCSMKGMRPYPGFHNASGIQFASEEDANAFVAILRRALYYHDPCDGNDIVLTSFPIGGAIIQEDSKEDAGR